MDNTKPSVAHDYYNANRMKHRSLLDLIEHNLVAGKGIGSVGAAISQKTTAKLTRIKETFDPMNIIKSLPLVGNYASYKYGKATGRSDEDIHYFTGYGERPSKRNKNKISAVPGVRSGGRIVGNLDTAKYTSLSEGKDQKFRRGDGLADLLARQLNLMKKYHNEELKQLKELHLENKKRAMEQAEWSKKIAALITGNKEHGASTPPPPDTSGGLFDTIKNIIIGAGGVGGVLGARKLLKSVGGSKDSIGKTASKVTEEPKITASKVTEEPKITASKVTEEPKITGTNSKGKIKGETKIPKTASKVSPDVGNKDYVKTRSEELKSQGKGNRAYRRQLAAYEKSVSKKGAKPAPTKPTAEKIPEKPVEKVPAKPMEKVTSTVEPHKLGGKVPKISGKMGGPLAMLLSTLVNKDSDGKIGMSFDYWKDMKKDIGEKKYGSIRELLFNLLTASSVGLAAATYSGNAGESNEIKQVNDKFKNFAPTIDQPKPIPQETPASVNLNKATDNSAKIKEENKASKSIIKIDNSKKSTSVSSEKDTILSGVSAPVRNHEESFAWVTGSNVRQV
jgi:hypothetical protein